MAPRVTPPPPPFDTTWLRIGDVAKRYGVTKARIKQGLRDGTFPPPDIDLGPRSRFWTPALLDLFDKTPDGHALRRGQQYHLFLHPTLRPAAVILTRKGKPPRDG